MMIMIYIYKVVISVCLLASSSFNYKDTYLLGILVDLSSEFQIGA